MLQIFLSSFCSQKISPATSGDISRGGADFSISGTHKEISDPQELSVKELLLPIIIYFSSESFV